MKTKQPEGIEEEVKKLLFDTNLRWSFIQCKINARLPITPKERDEWETAIDKTTKALQSQADKTREETLEDINGELHQIRASIPLTQGKIAREMMAKLLKRLYPKY